ncbi:MAG: DUF4173 domain-containing protein [Gemmatimonadaceae bacterium]
MATLVVERDEADVRDRNTRTARQILLQAALLGLLADNVFRNAAEGLGWTVWIGGLVVATVLVVQDRRGRFSREQLAWLTVVVACAAAVAWRDAELLLVANVVATLAALALFAMSHAGLPASSILSARVRDALAACVYAARDALSGAFPLLFREAELGSAIQASAAARRPALRAVLLTAPLVILFTALLSRADPVFGALFRLPSVNIEEIASHVLLGGIFAWLSAGWMRGSLLPTTRATLPEHVPWRLGIVDITTSLGALAGLFAVFVGMQLRWLFGGAEVVEATTGLTLAEYARRGFFELVLVAALVFPLILGTRAAITDDVTIRRHRRLSLALLVLLGAIMASAVVRMRLYVMQFGLSTDRLFALVFMTWLVLVFGALALTVLRGWSRPFAAMTVLSGFATLFALNAFNPEAIVARVNLGRSAAPRAVDYAYLSRLSGDAMPAVAPALAAAEPSTASCASARTLRKRWLSTDGTRSNLGSWRGREAVRTHLTPSRVRRLCAAMP